MGKRYCCCHCGWRGKGHSTRLCVLRLRMALKDVVYSVRGWGYLRSRAVTGEVLAVVAPVTDFEPAPAKEPGK